MREATCVAPLKGNSVRARGRQRYLLLRDGVLERVAEGTLNDDLHSCVDD